MKLNQELQEILDGKKGGDSEKGAAHNDAVRRAVRG